MIKQTKIRSRGLTAGLPGQEKAPALRTPAVGMTVVKKRSVVCGAVTCLVLVLSLYLLQRLLVPKYASGVVEGALIAEYYQEEKDHDVIFIGDCEVYENFSPAALWEGFGINSYIRGSPQQLIWQSYYLLEDTLRYETPDAVIFNVLSMQYDQPQSEAYNRMTLEGMRWSPSKVKSIQASMTEGEEFLDYVFPLLRYHSRWSELKREDLDYMFRTETVSHNGYYMRVDVKPAENVPPGRPLPDYRFGDNAWTYLDKITQLCRDRGIRLILVKAPSLYPCWYDEWEEQIDEYAARNDLLYLNFLELIDETGLDFRRDTYDGGLHLNLSGAEKVTAYLGQVLRDQAGLPDRRGEAHLSALWQEKLDAYRAEIHRQIEEYGVDTEPPVITGAQALTVEAGQPVSYRSGITVTDNVDASVSLQVDASQVDLTRPGQYPVVYSAIDAQGNQATVTITVTVTVPEPPPEETAPPVPSQTGAEPQIGTEARAYELADGILAGIVSSGMTQTQKAEAIFRYVNSHITYVGSSDKSNWAAEACNGFTWGRGDCFTYFACSKALLTRAGIPNVDLQRTGGQSRHYWQLVNVGSGYLHFDACPHPTGHPLRCFLLTEADVRAYSASITNPYYRNYYVYDYDACPVAAAGAPAVATQEPSLPVEEPPMTEPPAQSHFPFEDVPADAGTPAEPPFPEENTFHEEFSPPQEDPGQTGTQDESGANLMT